MNGTALWSAPDLPAALPRLRRGPLAEVLVSGHKGCIPNLTPHGARPAAGLDRHQRPVPRHVGLHEGRLRDPRRGTRPRPPWRPRCRRPAASSATAGRRVRGRLVQPGGPSSAASSGRRWRQGRPGLGAWPCAATARSTRSGSGSACSSNGYAHAVQPLEAFKALPPVPTPPRGEGRPVVTLRLDRRPALPGDAGDHPRRPASGPWRPAGGHARGRGRAGRAGQLLPAAAARAAAAAAATRPTPTESSTWRWERSARTIGLAAEVHRGTQADFTPVEKTLPGRPRRPFEHADRTPPAGVQHYAVVLVSGERAKRADPGRRDRPAGPAAGAPTGLKAVATPGSGGLAWQVAGGPAMRYHVYRAQGGRRRGSSG